MTADKKLLLPVERIERLILLIRGQKVMLDVDLAELYGVHTSALNRAFQRNRDRFPEDFVFQLTETEFEDLRRQNWHLKMAGRRYLPYAFTEQGVAMLSGILRSRPAIQVNVEIMRTFVRLRRMLASNAQLAARELEGLEKKYDAQFKVVFDTIRQLMTPPEPSKRKIGFIVKERASNYLRQAF